jgi:hypothetical protein
MEGPLFSSSAGWSPLAASPAPPAPPSSSSGEESDPGPKGDWAILASSGGKGASGLGGWVSLVQGATHLRRSIVDLRTLEDPQSPSGSLGLMGLGTGLLKVSQI